MLTDLISQIQLLEICYQPTQLDEPLNRLARRCGLDPNQVFTLWEAMAIWGTK